MARGDFGEGIPPPGRVGKGWDGAPRGAESLGMPKAGWDRAGSSPGWWEVPLDGISGPFPSKPFHEIPTAARPCQPQGWESLLRTPAGQREEDGTHPLPIPRLRKIRLFLPFFFFFHPPRRDLVVAALPRLLQLDSQPIHGTAAREGAGRSRSSEEEEEDEELFPEPSIPFTADRGAAGRGTGRAALPVPVPAVPHLPRDSRPSSSPPRQISSRICSGSWPGAPGAGGGRGWRSTGSGCGSCGSAGLCCWARSRR